jgi:hypothetical protein
LIALDIGIKVIYLRRASVATGSGFNGFCWFGFACKNAHVFSLSQSAGFWWH